jgi:hypothetical protein
MAICMTIICVVALNAKAAKAYHAVFDFASLKRAVHHKEQYDLCLQLMQ